jgi:hypothetical protein
VHLGGAENDIRAAGLELIERSAFFENAEVALEDRKRLVLMLFGARSRRLVAGAYHLADSGYGQEAAILIRSLAEYIITLHWLLLDFEAHDLVWQIDDVRATLALGRDAAQHDMPVMEVGHEAVFEHEHQRLRTELDELEDIDARVPEQRRDRMPGFEQRAQEAGLGQLYALAYRWDSLGAAHPNATALTQLLDRRGDVAVIRTEPVQELPDPYGIGPSLLAVVLVTIAEVYADLAVPDLADLAQRIPGLEQLAQNAAP